jgi:hypothetical protein
MSEVIEDSRRLAELLESGRANPGQ